LKEALQKLDNFQEKMTMIMDTNTYTLVDAEELLPLAKPRKPYLLYRILHSSRRETQLVTTSQMPGKMCKIYTSSLVNLPSP
jgi:hypothetical protein